MVAGASNIEVFIVSPIVDRRNIEFVLFDVFGLGEILASPFYAHCDRDTVEQILDSAERMATEIFLPSAVELDANPPRMVDGKVQIIPEVGAALAAYADAGLSAQTFGHNDGGLQLPYTMAMAVDGMFIAANQAIANYAILTTAAAHLLVAFGTDEQKRLYAAPMIEGRWTGTMCLSEPQAGSSLSDITTRAEPAGDGSYHLHGSKMWISGAGHQIKENIVNLVLAKIPGGAAGVKGISLFIVPQRLVDKDGNPGADNNVTLVGLNHKMGQRGITNCMLNFGETGATVGYLVGEPHQGLRYMFHMMNEARIGVGHGAAMSGLVGYLYSRSYAQERLQGRRIGQKDPKTPQVPLIEHPDIRRMLLAQKTKVEGAIALCYYCSLLIDKAAVSEGDERKDASILLDILTPIAKSWPSEHCLQANDLAIQVLGGAGYTLDHPVERLYRDNRLNPIHEGTVAIHGLDLLGRKVRLEGGRGLHLLADRINETIRQALGSNALSPYAARLAEALAQMQRATAAVIGQTNDELGLANATLYLDAAGTVVVAWLWLWQAVTAERRLADEDMLDEAFYRAKLAACRYCFEYILPATENSFALVEKLDDTFLSMPLDQILA
ncbi:acyl-CoA dehydrogenase [Sphingobium sp. JS3065]|uniref:acyl-CoA dehydrogenase n=1 Tax=Sphingobium sp. JS3065 TaxID=2970925 RepID=UPI002264C5E5|nr:acyl-CoA dehydrogenase [Sphingobium sp. JS3065]UZW56438.1 acyl-CoA dehydrogenase [Sphingobium sp. JS3065]